MPRQPFSIQPDLLERGTELAAIEDLIGGVAEGGRLLAIEGPPGIGKTALIGEAKALGRHAGLQVFGARGSEFERSFPYGVVRQLFEPHLASSKAEERAGLLTGAAALAAPLFDPAQVAAEPAVDSSLANLHGLYWLTANLAERRPLLLVVDDLQWSDLPSLRWLVYLLPRMEALDLLVLVGLRPPEPGEDQVLLGQIVADPLATMIRPTPLTVEATTRLLRETLSPDADGVFCAACQEETRGNPLLLRELLHVLADEKLAPTGANASRLRELGGRAGSSTVSLRLARLPQEAVGLAQAVAVLGDEADPGQAGTLAGQAGPVTSEAARALARVDVLRPQAPLGFVHPLIGAAVYESIAPAERDRAHARAARLLVDARAEPERVAAHLLRSSPCADARSVAILREAARRAASRGASESAVAYLRRALGEPPPAAERAELLVELGRVEALVDGLASIEHLRAAHELVEDPIHRAGIALLLARQLFLLRGEESDAVYARALDELGGADAELERLLKAGIITNDMFVPSQHGAAQERLEWFRNRLAGGTVGEKQLLSLLAIHDARVGVPAGDAVPLARRALAEGTLIKADVAGAVFPACFVLGMADLDEVLIVYDDMLAEAHRRGSPFAFAALKGFRAQTLVWRGDLGEAEEESREALAVAQTWGAAARFAGHATAFLADSLMEQGRLADASAALSQTESLPESVRLLWLRDSSARLRILRGDLAGGVAELLDSGRRFESVGSRNPAFIAWRSSAALALLQLGERDEARRLAGEEVELARRWSAPRALGAALRVAGVVEGGKRSLVLLAEAVEVLSNSPAKLEHAKARASLGAALRRANHRVHAREHLRRGVELARVCGAAPLAKRAETELLAAGARPRRIAISGVESLTPSELRVARMAARGPTNREIAEALFVTQRTVEVHLTSIFRKLAIDSRSQLAAAIERPAGP